MTFLAILFALVCAMVLSAGVIGGVAVIGSGAFLVLRKLWTRAVGLWLAKWMTLFVAIPSILHRPELDLLFRIYAAVISIYIVYCFGKCVKNFGAWIYARSAKSS